MRRTGGVMNAMAQPEIVRDAAENEPVAPGAGDARGAISQPTRSRGSTPSAEESGAAAKEPGSNRVLVIVLGIALVAAGLALVDQTRRAAAHEKQVAALEAEVAGAQAAVAAYQTRFMQVRDEVGALARRIGALNSLVTREVLPGAVSDAASEPASATAAPE